MGDQERFNRCCEICDVVLAPSATRKDVYDGYFRWSENYHEDLQDPSIKYGGPKKTALELQKLYPDNKDLYLLDAPAGTGLVAQNLKSLGYTNIDALEANDGMLGQAKARNLYNKYTIDYMGPNKLDIPDNTYDAITSCGSFYLTHVKGDALPEMIRITKPGGHIIIMTGEDDEVAGEAHHVYIADLDRLAAELETAGKWKKIDRKIIPVPEYYHDDRGALFIYQVL